MQKLRKLAYGAASGLVLLAPAVAHGLGAGENWDRGYGNAESSGLAGTSLYSLIATTLSWLLGVLGFIAVIGFVISGIMYLTAAGDETRAEKAKNAMTYSIIGVIVALMGFVIINAVTAWLANNNTF